MILVLAGERDDEARVLSERWARYTAVLLTPTDLSRAGWSVTFPDAGRLPGPDGTVSAEEISGVLVRIAFVTEYDVAHLVPEDRAYAAAEMTAFLSYWLSALRCPVANRPSPSFLIGPAWTHEQWLALATRLGIPVADAVVDGKRREAFAEEPAWVTVVGDRAFGLDAQARERALALARHAGVSILGVGFDNGRVPRLSTVSCRPPLLRDELCDAALGLLNGGSA